MTYQKRYRNIVPIVHGVDLDTARWLARESFENKAAGDGVELVEYNERVVPASDIPPKAMEQLGRPLTDFTFYEFSGLGRLNQELFDWLSAECAWRNDRTREWLDAERVFNIKQAHAQRRAIEADAKRV